MTNQGSSVQLSGDSSLVARSSTFGFSPTGQFFKICFNRYCRTSQIWQNIHDFSWLNLLTSQRLAIGPMLMLHTVYQILSRCKLFIFNPFNELVGTWRVETEPGNHLLPCQQCLPVGSSPVFQSRNPQHSRILFGWGAGTFYAVPRTGCGAGGRRPASH